MYKIFILLLILAFSSCGKINDIIGKKTDTENKEKKKEIGKKETDSPIDKEMPGYVKNHNNITSYALKDDETIIEAGTHMEWVFGKDYKPWTPSDEDVGNAGEMIEKCFEDQSRGTINRVLGRKPEDYCKQFVGAFNSNGERILWINFFCKQELDIFKEWKTNLVHAADGGNCFVQIKFNWDKNDGHYEMKVNGKP
jgi:hypothetical protein